MTVTIIIRGVGGEQSCLGRQTHRSGQPVQVCLLVELLLELLLVLLLLLLVVLLLLHRVGKRGPVRAWLQGINRKGRGREGNSEGRVE
jgi:hypothetical protein